MLKLFVRKLAKVGLFLLVFDAHKITPTISNVRDSRHIDVTDQPAGGDHTAADFGGFDDGLAEARAPKPNVQATRLDPHITEPNAHTPTAGFSSFDDDGDADDELCTYTRGSKKCTAVAEVGVEFCHQHLCPSCRGPKQPDDDSCATCDQFDGFNDDHDIAAAAGTAGEGAPVAVAPFVLQEGSKMAAKGVKQLRSEASASSVKLHNRDTKARSFSMTPEFEYDGTAATQRQRKYSSKLGKKDGMFKSAEMVSVSHCVRRGVILSSLSVCVIQAPPYWMPTIRQSLLPTQTNFHAVVSRPPTQSLVELAKSHNPRAPEKMSALLIRCGKSIQVNYCGHGLSSTWFGCIPRSRDWNKVK